MHRFITRHANKITGVLSGFDRLVFRGQLMPLCHEGGVRAFLASQDVLLKHFGTFREVVERESSAKLVRHLQRHFDRAIR